jgi:phosphopantothenoylcysteine decarboxylase/phosphopantothenate--cysteine ligase
VGKLATGIADTSVTLIASSLNGKGIPLMVLAVAHEDLINSPPIQESLDKLRDWGISIIEPVLREGKAKVPELEDVVFEVLTKLARIDLAGRKVIVTGGPTREYIDKVRYITNGSSGRMGLELAKAAQLNGGSVTLVMGSHSLSIPRSLSRIDVSSTQDMVDAVMAQLETAPDSIVILSSAMADFKPTSTQKGKIKSGETLSVELEPTVKLSDLIKTKYPQSYLVLFKAEWDVSPEELHQRALEKLHKTTGDLIIANDLSRPGAGFQTITNHVLIIDKEGNSEEASSTKTDLSFQIIDRVIRELNRKR